jgi:hypothetical protein
MHRSLDGTRERHPPDDGVTTIFRDPASAEFSHTTGRESDVRDWLDRVRAFE